MPLTLLIVKQSKQLLSQIKFTNTYQRLISASKTNQTKVHAYQTAIIAAFLTTHQSQEQERRASHHKDTEGAEEEQKARKRKSGGKFYHFSLANIPKQTIYCIHIQGIYMSSIIQSLQSSRLLWRAGDTVHNQKNTLSSGYSLLDDKLGGGWPDKGIIELQTALIGIGEIRLLLPALKAMQHSEVRQDKLYLWICPPGRLNAQTLASAGLPLSNTLVASEISCEHAFWVAEQSLRSGCCAAVILWCEQLEPTQAKRLQLAAKEGNSLGILIRPPGNVEQSLPISVRMTLEPHEQGLSVDISKRLGGMPVNTFDLDMSQQWPYLTRPAPVTPINHIRHRRRSR